MDQHINFGKVTNSIDNFIWVAGELEFGSTLVGWSNGIDQLDVLFTYYPAVCGAVEGIKEESIFVSVLGYGAWHFNYYDSEGRKQDYGMGVVSEKLGLARLSPQTVADLSWFIASVLAQHRIVMEDEE